MNFEMNGTIKSTLITRSHNIPTCMLNIDLGNSGQGFGGHSLEYYGVDYLFKIMDVVGVNAWEDLKGKHVRVRSENGLLVAIGHIIKDVWYEPQEDHP